MHIYDSPYIQLANQTLDWLPMDTQERYEENLQTRRTLLQQFNWIDTPIEYQFNSKGFRCEEFEPLPCVVFLGCSFTMGIGLPVADTWPSIVAKKLGLANFNLGIGGGSNDTAFRLGHYWLSHLKPRLVIWQLTFQYRIELLSIDQSVQIHGSDPDTWIGRDYMKHFITQPLNGVINKQKNQLALTARCADLECH